MPAQAAILPVIDAAGTVRRRAWENGQACVASRRMLT